jgi:hypothetical protein
LDYALQVLKESKKMFPKKQKIENIGNRCSFTNRSHSYIDFHKKERNFLIKRNQYNNDNNNNILEEWINNNENNEYKGCDDLLGKENIALEGAQLSYFP